ncbi:MAG: hypothetical protein KAR06_04255 [Deltaproteobacteria bacterium]|nr:hypothetical protein [Deltaproteobacteria bacterium]
MTDDRANEIIAKAMGVWETPPPEKIFQGALDPDYTDPTSYLEAMAWAKKQGWFSEFICEMVGAPLDILLDPKLGSHALASYLEGREG